MWFGGASLLLIFTPLFYLGLVLGVFALVIGVRAIRAAHRAHISAPGAVPGMVMGAIGTVCSLMLVVLWLFLYQELSDYTNCRAAANTISDQNQCKDAFAQAVEKKMHMPKGSLNGQKLPF